MATKRRWDLFNPMGYDPPYYHDEDVKDNKPLSNKRRLPKTIQYWRHKYAADAPEPEYSPIEKPSLDRHAARLEAKANRAYERRTAQSSRSNTNG